jgi:hypothetical protein
MAVFGLPPGMSSRASCPHSDVRSSLLRGGRTVFRQIGGLLNTNLPAQILTLLPKAMDRSSLGSFTTGLATTIPEFLRKAKLATKKVMLASDRTIHLHEGCPNLPKIRFMEAEAL